MAKPTSKTADKDANKDKAIITLGNLNLHAGVVGQAVMTDIINEAIKEQQSRIPMSAELNAQDKDERVHEENSNSTQFLDSIVEDSIGPLLEDGQVRKNSSEDSLKDSAHSGEAQDLPDAGLEELQREAERNLGFISGPIVIDSNTNLRASQIEGINLEVELNPKNYRKTLRSLTYEACMNSQECAELHNKLIVGANDQEQNAVLKELNQTKTTGEKLGIQFNFTDEMIMKKMIEIEAKEYSFLQKNSSAS